MTQFSDLSERAEYPAPAPIPLPPPPPLPPLGSLLDDEATRLRREARQIQQVLPLLRALNVRGVNRAEMESALDIYLHDHGFMLCDATKAAGAIGIDRRDVPALCRAGVLVGAREYSGGPWVLHSEPVTRLANRRAQVIA